MLCFVLKSRKQLEQDRSVGGNHLYFVYVTLPVRIPYTTVILQFGGYKIKISCVLDLESSGVQFNQIRFISQHQKSSAII